MTDLITQEKNGGMKQIEVNEQITLFTEFLDTQYKAQLFENTLAGKKFLTVSFQELSKFNPDLAQLLLINPEEVIKAFELSIRNFDLPQEAKNFKIRISNLPQEQKILVRDIRSPQLGRFIWTEGVVRQKSDVRPQVTTAKFECPSCGNVIPVLQLENKFREPTRCGCGRKGKFRLLSKELVDAQGIVLEEATKDLEGGAQPKRINLFLQQDLVSPMSDKRTNPGTSIRITGIIKEVPVMLRSGGQSTKFDLLIEVNHIEPVEEDYSSILIDPKEEQEILELAKDPNICEKLATSLAPGIYGHDKIKEALILQFAGGYSKITDDGVKKRGDIHVLLIGDPGAGKTINGSSSIILSDGSFISVKDFVDKYFYDDKEYCSLKERILIPSLNRKGELEHKLITGIWKRKKEQLYLVKTKTGKEIACTATNPFFRIEKSKVYTRKTENLQAGDYIAIPRAIPQLQLSEQTFMFNNTPHPIDKNFARFLAYILSEGYCIYDADKKKYRIEFVNNNPILINDFKMIASLLFNKHLTIHHHNNKRSMRLILHNKNIIQHLYFLEPYIFKKSFHKKIPQQILKSPDTILIEFLRTFFECDGTVDRKHGVSITLASKSMIEQIQYLLLRLGIMSQLHPCIKYASNTANKTRRMYWRLTLYGDNARRYYGQIGFISQSKNDLLKETVSVTSNTNLDIIPGLKDTLTYVRQKLHMTQFDMKIPRTTYQHYERGDRYPSRESLKQIVEKLKIRVSELLLLYCKVEEISVSSIRQILHISPREYIKKCLNDEQLLRYLNDIALLVDTDVCWDQIQSIKPYESDEPYIYDLEVEDNHNFIANGIFIHNSQLLKRASVVAPKARYVSGKGVSGAGLTAAVVRDEFLGGWSLEAGALVLANKGVLMIDEMDKMSPEDRSAMHEGLEQQSFHYDTLFQFSDGSEMKIGEYVESVFQKNPHKIIEGKDCFVLTLDCFDKKMLTTDWYSIYETSINHISKHIAPSEFIEITSGNGRTITVTPEHPIYCIKEGHIITKPASELDLNDWIPIPLHLPIQGNVQEFNLNSSQIYNCRAQQHIKVPIHNDKDFFKIIGYILSEGSLEINRGKPIGINFTNNDLYLINDFIGAMERFFGLKPYLQQTKKEGESWFMARYVSTELLSFLEKKVPEMLTKSHSKQIPQLCMKGSLEDIPALLSALFEGDGHASKKLRTIRVGFASTSKRMVEQVQDLLLRFKIRSNNTVHNGCYKVSITGYENLYRFSLHIGFISERKNKIVQEYIKHTDHNIIRTVKDIIPTIGKEIIYLFDKYKIKAVGNNALVTMRHDYIALKKNISRKHLQKAVLLLEEKLHVKDAEKISYLRQLAFSDIGFEKIRSIRKIPSLDQKWTYDITIEPHHTFISQNMVLHNTISISKANIQATLRCDTTVLAAANPKFGRFDPYETINKQIDMPPALINRFDLIFVIKDLPDEEQDKKIAKFILTMHKDHQTQQVPISTEVLRKYLIYARQKIFPHFSQEAVELLQDYYVKMRSSGSNEDGGIKAIPISARQLDALVRLSEAAAKVRLSQVVNIEDAQRAIFLLQYCLQQVGIDPETGKLDIDRISIGITSSQRNKIAQVRDIINDLEEALGKIIPLEEIMKHALEKGLTEAVVEESLEKLKRSGDIFSPKPNHVQKI